MLQSLERHIGLPIALEPTRGELHWPEAIGVGEVSARRRGDLAEFIAGKDDGPRDEVVYTVYRHIARREDGERLAAAHLRYDLTVIRPGAFSGGEFFRTAGHYHTPPPGRDLALPEVYEVIAGRAYWLIQRPTDGDSAELLEIYAVEAGPGEKAVMPPGFGHISVNASAEPLVMANWVGDEVAYDYAAYRRLRGAGYRALAGPGESIAFEPNPAYRSLPDIVKLRPREVPALGLSRKEPLAAFAADPGRLAFLRNPEAYADLLTIASCYRRLGS